MFQLNKKMWIVKNAYVLVTGLQENERILQEVAKEIQYIAPEDFAGEKIYVYHKMNYVEPYEKFDEIKKLQTVIKNATGLRANFKGIVAIDVQEWLDHLKDEYFLITLKFLYDHLQFGWHYIFTVGNKDKTSAMKFVLLLARYFKPYIIEMAPFGNQAFLEEYAQRYMEDTGKTFALDTLKKFVRLLGAMDEDELKDLEIVKNIIRDIADSTNKKVIGNRELKTYLAQGDSLMNLLLPMLKMESDRGGMRND